MASGDSADKSTHAEEGQESPPVLHAELVLPQPLLSQYETHQKNSQRIAKCKLKLDILSVILTFFTLLAVIVYATLAGYQWSEMRRANSIAQDAITTSNRPWVGVVPGTPIKDLEVGKAPTVITFMQNYGRSPAFNIIGQSVIVLAPSTLSETELIRLIDKGSIREVGTVWPDSKDTAFNTATLPYPLTAELLNAINDGTRRIIVAGRVVYRDIFSKEHHTWIQIVYLPDIKALGMEHPEDAPPDD